MVKLNAMIESDKLFEISPTNRWMIDFVHWADCSMIGSPLLQWAVRVIPEYTPEYHFTQRDNRRKFERGIY